MIAISKASIIHAKRKHKIILIRVNKYISILSQPTKSEHISNCTLPLAEDSLT